MSFRNLALCLTLGALTVAHGQQSPPRQEQAVVSRTSADAWWKHAVIYEVYPRSFQDSDGDGKGDIKGIESRLEYLKTLGIDAIWITPHVSVPAGRLRLTTSPTTQPSIRSTAPWATSTCS